MLRKSLRRLFCANNHTLDESLNVLGTQLKPCCFDPMTGFYRDGYCNTGLLDQGRHLVCVQVTDEFLEFSKRVGNDLSTPRPGMFPGLKHGDKWCVCVLRWKEALMAGKAPKLYLEATHFKALEYVEAKDLMAYALDVQQEI